jgi:NAD kinase
VDSDIKVVLIKRQTRLEQLIAQYNTEAQVRFVIESRGGDVHDYYQEHQHYVVALRSVQTDLHALARVHVLDKQFLPNYLFGPDDIVVVVGQDGLVANTLKYLRDQPVIAINPDPDRFDGVLLPYQIRETTAVIKAVAAKSFATKSITMAQMTLNDGQQLLAVNDFYIGPRFPISAQYRLTCGNQSEEQSSSGIIVSTGLGSSGWLKSVVTGASKITGQPCSDAQFAWDSSYLRFVVREPFPSR